MDDQKRALTNVPIYLFDGHCVLCSRAVNYILRHEREPNIHFVAITSQMGRDIARVHNIDPDNPTTFLFIENNEAFESSDAIFAFMKHLGGPSKYLGWLKVIPRPLRDFMYQRIANNRYRIFGKTEACLVPSAQARERFTLS